MVHYQALRLDDVFGALAHPARRAVLSRLEGGERTVGELARPFAMSLTALIKHLGILEDAGLIEREKTGRVVSCRLKPGALKDARAWLDRHEAFWNARLDRLGDFLDRKENDAWTSPPTTGPASTSGGTTRTASPSSTRRGRTRTR
jgi:DNA-binding transcriptional ArsR family regulator